ncbi:glycosyltransferase family 4 protein [Gilvimarinus xylanilyticus]|uniref:Glycosyltransferase family 4 protein n=1 Tax=Gilvimarinus xylanilyticus TaxID=2944139 RepID=A0A9X2KUT1_9GAMM|nr:glycosyltransferase family 4 protein [Gilvimarinus xylanilyticus]MCP8900223.1 glycosyltransferase family 4 protein [Gilvimarinus xylanilyticus]
MTNHVLVVVSEFPKFSETFVVDHLRGMLLSGWMVSVVAYKVNDEMVKCFFEELSSRLNVKKISLFSLMFGGEVNIIRAFLAKVEGHSSPWSLHARFMALKANRIARLIKEIDPDLVHAHFGPNGIICSLALKNFHCPYIVNFHGYDVSVYPKKHGWGVYRKSLCKAVLVCHSDYVEEVIKRNLKRSVKHVVLGVDTERFSPDRPRRLEWGRQIRLLSVGRLEKCKGHDVAIDVLDYMRQRHPEIDFVLSIGGDGDERNSLEEKVRVQGLSSYVSFLGKVRYEEVPNIMRKDDILLVCSQSTEDGWKEAFCRVAVEGMAAEMAVVVTPCGGLPDTVRGAGYVASQHDALSIVKEVERLIFSQVPRSIARKSAKAAEVYCMKKMIKDYVFVSEEAIKVQ